MTEAIRDRDYCKKAFNAIMEDFNEMGRTYEAKLHISCRVGVEGSDPFNHRG